MLNRVLLALVVLSVFSAHAFAALPQDALQAAARQGSPALMLVTGPEAQDIDAARSTVSAAAKLIKGCVTVEMDRAEAANAPFVARYGLAGAPVPLVLVFARNGSLAGGIPAARATPPVLVSMIPSPKKAEALQALESGGAVLLVASRKSMKEKAKVMENCALACGKVKATTVQIDLDDAAEKSFLDELRVDAAAATPVTLVVNSQGQITGEFKGAVDVAALAQAAAKRAAGCCPTGGAKSCPPPKK